MDILFTLDYELFFGSQTGNVDNTLRKTTDLLLGVFNAYDIKATFFVDIGFIKRCQELDVDSYNYNQFVQHLRSLIDQGHELQLHIHPHWEDAVFINGKWDIDVSRYKLHDYSKEEAACIVQDYSNLLNDTFNIQARAFRAGGWCLQPFSHISDPLHDAGIVLDSTVFAGGTNNNGVNYFDFRKSPKLPYWSFTDDPLHPLADGQFIELPIASLPVSPLFYWKLAMSKKLGGEKHHAIGEGMNIKASKFSLVKMLVSPGHTVVSIDGFKASLLEKSYQNMSKQYGDKSPMVIIGHPKSLTQYSLRSIDRFLADHHRSSNYITIGTWLKNNEGQ